MAKNLNEKRKNVMDKIHNFKLSGKNFSLKSHWILILKIVTFLSKIPLYFLLIRENLFKLKGFAFKLLLIIDLILSIVDLFENWAIFSYIKLAQDVIDDYRRIERMQKEICDLEIEIKTKKESLLSI